ncbi:MAG: hypothetical protein SGCHY_000667 [Lobulomycetales sp.]
MSQNAGHFQLALQKKDARILQLEGQVRELRNTMEKLQGFRQSILRSFGQEELEEMLPASAASTPLPTAKTAQPNESNIQLQPGPNNTSPRLYLKKDLSGNASSLGLVKETFISAPQSPLAGKRDNRLGSVAETNAAFGGSESLSQSTQPARSKIIDGKEFFKVAKETLSRQQFDALLSNVKSLNSRSLNKFQVVGNMREALGPEHNDILLSFERMLSPLT